MKTKFIRKSTEEIPEYGTYVVIDYDGQMLLSRYNIRTTEEWFKSNYKYYLVEVEDIEQELQETIEKAKYNINLAIDSLSNSLKKIEYYQEKINEKKQ